MNTLKRPSFFLFVCVLIGSVVLSALVYHMVVFSSSASAITPAPVTPSRTPTPVPTKQATTKGNGLPVQNPALVRGIEGDPQTDFAGITWLRIGYPTCGWGNLQGKTLRDQIAAYHHQGIRVLLTVCQEGNDARLYNTQLLNDAAQGGADAVQCGNEEMKQDPSVAFLYIPPENFARFYDLCEQAVHAVRSDIPVLLGSLDPHVGGVDYQPLLDQVHYLDQMQTAMNTKVHPGGHWDWHAQILGLIDSWHNGWNNGQPDATVNSLSGLFSFWAQQFHVNLDKGELGNHIWVVEGTGCFKGCGIDVNSPYEVAASHILTLITDVVTTLKYGVPFFYFSGKDFVSAGVYWPIGVLDLAGHEKPLRQDLPIGARELTMNCSGGSIYVIGQEQLLSKLYAGCSLPTGYIDSLTK